MQPINLSKYVRSTISVLFFFSLFVFSKNSPFYFHSVHVWHCGLPSRFQLILQPNRPTFVRVLGRKARLAARLPAYGGQATINNVMKESKTNFIILVHDNRSNIWIPSKGIVLYLLIDMGHGVLALELICSCYLYH
jgi:hypothetical protein